MEPNNLVVVIDPLLGLDASIEVWIVVDKLDIGPPHIEDPILSTPRGFHTQALALVIGAVVKTLTKVLSLTAFKT
jgi:hypothetical protein